MSRDEQKDNGLNPDWDDLDLDWLREEMASSEWEKPDLSWLHENVKPAAAEPAAEPANEPAEKTEPVQTARTEKPKPTVEDVEKSMRAAILAGAQNQNTARPADEKKPQQTARTAPEPKQAARTETTTEKEVPTWSDPPRRNSREKYEEEGARSSRRRDTSYEEEAPRSSRRRDTYYEEEEPRSSRRRDTYYEEEPRSSRRRDAYYEEEPRSSHRRDAYYEEESRNSRRRDVYYEEDMSRTGRRVSRQDGYYDSRYNDEDYRRGGRGKTNVLMILLVVLLVGGLLFAVWQLGSIFLNYQRDRSAYNDLAGNAISDLAEEEESGSEQQAPEETASVPVSEVPITVDWKYLKSINSDTVAWLYCPNTIINYPVVQTPDHEFYLNHGFDRQPNTSGALFADRSSSIGVLTSNFIIYGHNMKDNSMFGTYKNYVNQSFYEQNPVMYLLTPEKNYRVELVCAHIVEGTIDNFPVYFSDMTAFQSYLNKISTNSFWINYDYLNTNYQLLTMSTCTTAAGYSDARLLVHGALVPIE